MEYEESSLTRLSLRLGMAPEEVLTRLLASDERLYRKIYPDEVILAVKKNYFPNLRHGETQKESIYDEKIRKFSSHQIFARVLPTVRYLQVPVSTLRLVAVSKRKLKCDSFTEELEIRDSNFECIDSEFFNNRPEKDYYYKYPAFIEYCIHSHSTLPVTDNLRIPHSSINLHSIREIMAGVQDLHTDPTRIEEILEVINRAEKFWKSQQLIDLQMVFHATWTDQALSAKQVRQWEEIMDTALSKESEILRVSKNQRAFCIKSVRPKDFDRILKKTPKSGIVKMRGEGEIGRMYDSICRIARKLYDDGSANAKLPKQEIVKKILAIEKMPLAMANKVATLIKIDAKPSPRTGRPPKRK